MLSRANSVSWMGEREDEDSSVSWNRNHGDCNGNEINREDLDVAALSSLKSMLDVENEWYNNITNPSSINFSPNLTTTPTTTATGGAAAAEAAEHLLLHQIDSSASCSPSPSVFNTPLDPSQLSFLLPSKPTSLFSNTLAQHGFDLSCGESSVFFQDTHQIPSLVNRGNGGVLGGFSEMSPQTQMGTSNLVSNPQFSTAHLVQFADNHDFGSGSRFRGFDQEGLGNSIFMNRASKILKPLENCAPVGAQPTLFQKRAALRRNFANASGNSLNSGSDSGLVSNGGEGDSAKLNSSGENEKKRKSSNLDNVSFDGSAFNYDSDDFTEINIKGDDQRARNGGTNSNANSTVTRGGGDSKGKKKGLPAKNLMAERRRRKKLNDRLYMLRSVVPKISKMDRASILGDAIEYLKELLQKINDLHNELESSPPTSSLTQTTSFHPLTPTLPNLPSRIKVELCPSSLPSPNGQPARIEVRLREGRAVNIHMFCGRKPGLLLSTMRALDGLGLDIQQAVISCFNEFAMDIFRAEQCKDGQDVHPEQIKSLLLDLATFHGSTVVGNCDM